MSIPDKPVERRHHQRVVFHSTAQMSIQDGPLTPIRTLNISVGGLSAIASVNPAPNAHCVIQMSIPDQSGATSTELHAQVVQSNFSKIDDGFLVNFKFVNLTASAAARIARFMASIS